MASTDGVAPPPGRMTSLRQMQNLAASFRESVDCLYSGPEESAEAQPTINITALSSSVKPTAPGPSSQAPTGTVKPTAGPTGAPAPAWVNRVNKLLEDHPLTVAQIVLRDKLTFVVGLANVMLSALLLAHPRAFILLFQMKSVVLMTSRWVVYRLKGWHYYLLEFCNAVILIGLLHTSCLQTSPALYKLTISLFAGVLTGAVVATRNAFVLHSIDKITSLFQHLSPALVAWLLRWQPSASVPGWTGMTAEQQAAFHSAGFVQLTLIPMGVWLLWAIIYYILVFVVADEKVRERGYATMFKLQTRNPSAPVSRFVFSFKTRPLQYAAYLAVHGSSVFIGCLLNNLWWHSRAAHTLLLAIVLLSSMWTGACYYFDVFSKKYQKLLQEVADNKPKTS